MDPWSKGDYSRHIPEAIMVMERPPEVNSPSGRVPGQLLLAIPRSESRRRRNSGRNRVTGNSSRVSVSGAKYMPKEDLRGAPWPRRPEGAATPLAAPGRRLAWGWPPSGPPSGFWSLLLWIFFWYFFWNFPSTFIFILFLQCTDDNRQKLELGTELVGSSKICCK